MSSILKVSEIQDPTNGNTALTVDSSGNTTAAGIFYPKGLTYWPSCNYSKTSSQTSSAASEKITFDVKIYDNGDNFNASTGIFTCPISGIYIATFVGLTNNDTTGNNYNLYQNSTIRSRGRTGTSSGHQTETLSAHINAAANDTIYVVIHTSGQTIYADANVWTTIHITYIGG